jgi:hypothetical protein
VKVGFGDRVFGQRHTELRCPPGRHCHLAKLVERVNFRPTGDITSDVHRVERVPAALRFEEFFRSGLVGLKLHRLEETAGPAQRGTRDEEME